MQIEERTAELKIAMQSMESLLHQILPASVADKLAKGEEVHPESYDSVTIYFSGKPYYCTFRKIKKITNWSYELRRRN